VNVHLFLIDAESEEMVLDKNEVRAAKFIRFIDFLDVDENALGFKKSLFNQFKMIQKAPFFLKPFIL
jgi:hypothetical protein